jgi:hypothetical protein
MLELQSNEIALEIKKYVFTFIRIKLRISDKSCKFVRLICFGKHVIPHMIFLLGTQLS